ncbi:6-phosphogluconolactonase [Candidatus Peregrinibacteria bacterium]|nr:6-phosphogluconolactonase [bacterium]NCQ55830.1 6-phosphogluconolactonase [Candidatus Parcubacteria bacterium]NCS67897.1 6-phosphogluconolactonase [Candidatus Peregrinibacteria bacterium]
MAQIKTFADLNDFWTEVSAFAAQPSRMALSGGSAASVVEHLKITEETEIFLADERCVGTDDENSNARLIREKLSNRKYTDQLDFYKPGLSAQECAAEYELQLKTENDYLFDLVVLGVGPDGHTASLFPGAEALMADGLTTVAQTEVFAVRERLSLTFKALEASAKILVLLQGKGKKEIFEIITNVETDSAEYPARRLLDFPQAHIYWLNV